MKPDDEPILWYPSPFAGFLMKVCQAVIFCGIGAASIWFQEENDYPINPVIMGAWCFMGAYGFTLAVNRLALLRLRRAARRERLLRMNATAHQPQLTRGVQFHHRFRD